MNGPVLIVAALAEELAALRERVLCREGKRLGALRVDSGMLEGRPVVLAVTGEGARNAERALPPLLVEARPRRLIAMGVAGGLSPGLERGAVLMASEVRRAGSAALVADHAPRGVGVVVGVVVCAPGWVSTPAEKAALWRQLAPGEVAVADLESWSYARAAQDARVPWSVVRAVSDAHDDALPPFLLECRDREGVLRRRAVVAYSLRHPSALPQLVALRTRMRACARGLSRGVACLVADSVKRGRDS